MLDNKFINYFISNLRFYKSDYGNQQK